MRPRRRRTLALAASVLTACGCRGSRCAGPHASWRTHVTTRRDPRRRRALGLRHRRHGRRRLFIARQTRVMVVDRDRAKLLGEIPGLERRPRRGARRTRAGHGFATSGRDSSVTMFDLRTLRGAPAEIGGRRRGCGAVRSGVEARLHVQRRRRTLHRDRSVPVAVVGTVPLGGKPEFGVADGAGRLYVNIEDKAEVGRDRPGRPAR